MTRIKHPGIYLKAELVSRGITQKKFAKTVGMYPSHFSDLIHGRRKVSMKLAIKIAKDLGGIPEYWRELQDAWDIYKINQEK